METFKCKECGKLFRGCFNKKRNQARQFCSLECRYKNQKTSFKGENNPNYKSGIHCEKSICECGNEKDYRAKQCATCSNRSIPVGQENYYDDELMLETIKNSSTIMDVNNKLKYNRKSIAKYIKANDVDISHFDPASYRPYLLEQLLKVNTKRMSVIRKVVLKYNLLEYKCSICGQEPIWMDKPITLEVHHIDGNPLDNNIENLTILCPNCHSQTMSYKGKNSKKNKDNEVKI